MTKNSTASEPNHHDWRWKNHKRRGDEVMKITAQLALSQMKVNKKRSIAAMSITVVSNFFSANVAYIRQMYKCQ